VGDAGQDIREAPTGEAPIPEREDIREVPAQAPRVVEVETHSLAGQLLLARMELVEEAKAEASRIVASRYSELHESYDAVLRDLGEMPESPVRVKATRVGPKLRLEIRPQ
jgi:hypothetical protein